MINQVTSRESKEADEMEVCKLKYGTLVTGVDGHPSSHYIKVSKEFGVGIKVQWPVTNSILLNVRTGSLRAVKGSSRVRTLTGELIVEKAEASQFRVQGGNP